MGDETVIIDQDRSGWFGASDTAYIMGNWNTKTFKRWWLQKLGLNTDHFTSKAMNAGTYYEHAVLDFVGAERRDHQIIIPELRLRVNLDGDGPGKVHEVKTHSEAKPFKVTKGYWQQVQVQIFAKHREEKIWPVAEVISYGLLEDDYRNFFNEIDPERVRRWPVERDTTFILEYMKRIIYLAGCLEKGVFPDEAGIHDS